MKTRLIIHAGTGKTGSTTIQQFLFANATALEERYSVTSLSIPRDETNPGELRLVRTQHSNGEQIDANWFSRVYRALQPEPITEQLEQQLAQFETGDNAIVISGESISRLLLREHPRFMACLKDLARRFDVRVVMYVRPQHSYMEAVWREWGFREGHAKPSDYFRKIKPTLFYAQCWDYWATHAPTVQFLVRPFVQHLLEGQDLLADFCRYALEIDIGSLVIPEAKNVGMSLSAINLLRALPESRLWNNPNDNRLFKKIKMLEPDFTGLDETEVLCKALLKELCGLWYAKSNAEFAKQFPWAVDDFIQNAVDSNRSELQLLGEIDKAFVTRLSTRQREFVLSLLIRALK